MWTGVNRHVYTAPEYEDVHVLQGQSRNHRRGMLSVWTVVLMWSEDRPLRSTVVLPKLGVSGGSEFVASRVGSVSPMWTVIRLGGPSVTIHQTILIMMNIETMRNGVAGMIRRMTIARAILIIVTRLVVWNGVAVMVGGLMGCVVIPTSRTSLMMSLVFPGNRD